MNWEKRGDSDYYYRKYRIGNSVFSRYAGSGKIADLAFEEDQLLRDRSSFERVRQHRLQEDEKVMERWANRVYTRNTTIFKALMLISGYHNPQRTMEKNTCLI